MKEKEKTPAPKPKEVKAKKKANPSFQSLKGMRDILPADWPLWDKIISVGRELAEYYSFFRIETPILEEAGLFAKGVGEGTDIVDKEMYAFKTKGGGQLALRPEYTAPVMRSYLEHGFSHLPQPQRFYYFGPLFRHENPQAMRYRELRQFGFEVIGSADAVYDAEVITAAVRFLEGLKIKNISLQINSIGCRVCRPNYVKKLVEFYKKQDVCRDCKKRLETNPLRVLDCKDKKCLELRASAPSVLDHLCQNCRTHFRSVLEYLDEISLPYVLNPSLVRGLDYYSRTVFEIFAAEEEVSLAGGGRYDYLAELLGGRPTPAIGVGIGLDRLVEVIKKNGNLSPGRIKPKIFLIHVGEVAKRKSFSIIEELRRAGVPVAAELGRDSLSAQMELASKAEAPLALIFGQRESYEESIIIRDMKTGVQEAVPLTKMVEEVKRRISR